MKVTVRKWGNSASIRIPAPVMQAASLRLDQPVDVREEHGRIIIEAVRKPEQPPEYDIEALVAAITDESMHDLIDTGPPAGSEVW